MPSPSITKLRKPPHYCTLQPTSPGDSDSDPSHYCTLQPTSPGGSVLLLADSGRRLESHADDNVFCVGNASLDASATIGPRAEELEAEVESE